MKQLRPLTDELQPSLCEYAAPPWSDALLGSLSILQQQNPVLIIEIHNEILRRRGMDFKPVLDALKAIGYGVAAFDDPDYLHSGNCHIVMQVKAG